MSINKLLLAGVAGTFLAGSAVMAAEPVKLTDAQMDDVTAGFLRLTLGLRLTNTEAFARRQTIETSTYFEADTKDETEVDANFVDNSNGISDSVVATSKLASKLNTGSTTTVRQRGGAWFGSSSLKAAGTLNIEPSANPI